MRAPSRLVKATALLSTVSLVSAFVIQEAAAQRYRNQFPGAPGIGPLNSIGYPLQKSYTGGGQANGQLNEQMNGQFNGLFSGQNLGQFNGLFSGQKVGQFNGQFGPFQLGQLQGQLNGQFGPFQLGQQIGQFQIGQQFGQFQFGQQFAGQIGGKLGAFSGQSGQ